MIIVKFSGGLGNQMFQYGMYYALKRRYPQTKVKADVSFYHNNKVHQGFELNRVFHLVDQSKLELCTAKEYRIVTGEREPKSWIRQGGFSEKIWAWLNARGREKATRLGTRNVILEESAHESLTDEKKDERKKIIVELLNHLDVEKHWYVDGYWQDEVYFGQDLNELRQDFIFPTMQDERDLRISNLMEAEGSVSIHIRRGDYINSEYDVLTERYYRNAVEYLKKKKPGVTEFCYYVFSEDVDYVRAHYQWLENCVFIDWHKGADSYRDIQLMSRCKYQIVANSSFSTWAGYLNNHSGRIICYPRRYTKDLSNNKKNEPGWEVVEC